MKQAFALALVALAALGGCNNSAFFTTLGNKIEVPQLLISPTTATVPANGSTTFSASGGVPPYTYSITSGPGTINAGTGLYTAPASPGVAVIQVKDKQGTTATAVANPVTYAVTAVNNTGLLFAGGAAAGNFTIQNQGSSNGAQQISWTVYASPTSTLGSGSSVIQSSTTPALPSGNSSTVPFAGTWPTTPGAYYLIASITSTDSAGASLATASTFAVVAAQVSYTVTAVNYISASTTPGGAVSGNFQYHNGGPNNGIQNVSWQAYASTTTSLTATPAPVLIASGIGAPPLNNGVTSGLIPFSGSWPLVYGNYYVVIKLTVQVDNDTSGNNLGATGTSTPVGIYSVGTPHAPYTSPYNLGIAFQPGMIISVTGTLSSVDPTDFLEYSTGTAASLTFSATWSPSATGALQVADPTTGTALSGPIAYTATTSASLGPWTVDLPATSRLFNISSSGPYTGAYVLIVTAN